MPWSYTFGHGAAWPEPTLGVEEKPTPRASKYPTWPEGETLYFRIRQSPARSDPPVEDSRLHSHVVEVREEYHHYPLGAIQRVLGSDEGWVLEQEFPFDWKPEDGYGEPWRSKVSQIWARMVKRYYWWIGFSSPADLFAFIAREGEMVALVYSEGQGCAQLAHVDHLAGELQPGYVDEWPDLDD